MSRKKLMKVLSKSKAKHNGNDKNMLQGMNIRTTVDILKAEETVASGVLKGSLLTQTPFTVYMDTYSDKAEEEIAEAGHQAHPSIWELVFLWRMKRCMQPFRESATDLEYINHMGNAVLHDMEPLQVKNNILEDWGEGQVFRTANQELEVVDKQNPLGSWRRTRE